MSEENENLRYRANLTGQAGEQHSSNTVSVDGSEQEEVKLDFASMMQHVSPTMRKVVIYQGIVLVVLAMIFFGGLIYKTTVYFIADEGETAGKQSVSSLATAPFAEDAPLIEPESVGSQPSLLRSADGLQLPIRPEGAILISVRQEGDMMTFHFRHDGKDYLKLYNKETGSVESYVIP